MAIIEGLLTFAALCGFCLAFACVGSLVLKALKFQVEGEAENLLVSIGVGLLCTEIVLFWIQFTQHIRQGSMATVGLLCLALLLEGRVIVQRVRALMGTTRSGSAYARLPLLLLGVVLAVEFLASLAPLTGSDALHYHFTVQKLILAQGFHPLFSYSHSFLCGQHHLLILLALALGSEKLGLGFIFLGGVLTAGVLACLAGQWASERTAMGIVLLFLLTPLVFWQISSSGSPDIFMAFYVGLTVLALTRKESAGIWRQALLAGLLTGGIAGAKYTGCLIAAALAVTVVVEFRSAAVTAAFVLGSLASGVWPYVRNVIWTGNPVFPFLSERLSPHLVSAYALRSLAEDTGAASFHSVAQLVPFMFFAGFRATSPGFWDFFGPTVFALAPLILLAFRNGREWRVPVLVWMLSSVGIFFSSGLARFLLPLFPIGLSCVAAGIEELTKREWRLARGIAAGAVVLMILMGAAGLAAYCRKPILASVGLTSRETYLEERAQNYQTVEAINQTLETSGSGEKVLVFSRHQYYLRVPHVNGDPAESFEVDPERLKTPEQWLEFFRTHGIGYVVRAPEYPRPIAEPLNALEKRGALTPYVERNVKDFKGMRVNEERVTVKVVILKLNN